jgi:NADH-quinone oxidoreductase subunit F
VRGPRRRRLRDGHEGLFLPKGDMDKYVVCNADESEPGTFKDRELMQKNPHLLIEGLAIAAYAVGANKAFIFIRGEYELQATILEEAVAEAKAENLLGGLDLWVHRGAGAYICGEETALLDALEGKRGNPRLKPPFPAVQGLYKGPTLINNVETLMNAPIILRMGGAEYAKIGTERSTGTKVVSVSGCVRPGQLRDRARIAVAHIFFGSPAARDWEQKQGMVPRRSCPRLAGTTSFSTCPIVFDSIAESRFDDRLPADLVIDDSVSIV